MTTIINNETDRRRAPRQTCDDALRWKRPGRIEDHTGWALDISSTGLGFLSRAESCPRVGDRLNIRRLDGQDWTTIDRPIRVARVSPTSGSDMVVVGCEVGWTGGAIHADAGGTSELEALCSPE